MGGRRRYQQTYYPAVASRVHQRPRLEDGGHAGIPNPPAGTTPAPASGQKDTSKGTVKAKPPRQARRMADTKNRTTNWEPTAPP